MSREIKVVRMSDRSPSLIDWGPLLDRFSKNYKLQIDELEVTRPNEVKELNAVLKDKDIVLVDRDLRNSLSKVVQHRSVGSHFLQYFDYLENREGRWWGYSIFSSIFYKIMLKAIKNQDYKGSVIFLGANSLVLPIMEVLTGFGFTDFVFLNSEDNEESIQNIKNHLKGFIGIQVSIVDSTAFIQSQKEYSLCFVMNESYSRQILDDMSYFHFLSNRSIVFDIVGSTNFLFKEVKALGVEIVEHAQVTDLSLEVYLEKMDQFARDIG